MSDWTAGYVADIGYTYGYYSELNPLRAKLALLNSGYVVPEFANACELGFGQGLSTNLHAAGSQTQWHGNDFNPAQAAFAQELAAVSGSGALLSDDSFAEFFSRQDLPDFDYIGLHGIWSWISDDNRRLITDFVRRKLKVGGVLYISYNTLPGWAAFAPMRHLMTEHAELLGSEGLGIINRIDGAIDFADRLMATNPLYSKANPLVADRIKKLKDQNRHYLAHEYFNRDWHPMHFATIAGLLEDAKVQFACSAHYLDHIDVVNLTKEQQTFLSAIPNRMYRESVRDFMVNQQFRRDYWVKGLRRISPLEQAEQLRKQRVLLTTPATEVKLKVSGALGEAELHATVYQPVLDVLADNSPKTIAEIEGSVSAKGISFAQLLQAVMILAGAGYLNAVQSKDTITKASVKTRKLNHYLCKKAIGSTDINYLVSPVTGGGYNVNRFQQMFLYAISSGKKSPEEWGRYVWDVVSSQGSKLVKEGKTLETAEENLSDLIQQAQTFAQRDLPILKALDII